ncbi:MAG: coenzyme hydrogenase subunit [Prolixibacteraceae bacterium]|nr:MAG: coenzyme hydrogenase subunit [Prolixibacteraceae bacterium]
MIAKILNNNLCAGCGLCQSIFGENKISVKLNNDGFYRPNVNQKLNKSEGKLLSKVCPAITVKKDKTVCPKKDVVWGEMFSCFICSSSDDEIRNEASSGGGISAVLFYLLKTQKVSAIIHIGASKEIPYLNEVKISTTRAEIIENANSRYAPSAPLQNILDNIKQFESYAFVGKPCDIAALRQYSGYNAEVKNKIKYYISFFCAGVPSLNATTDIISSMDLNIDDIKAVSYRKDGWPGFFKVTDKANRIYKLSYSLTWMKLLGPRVQFRCKICADGIGHLADVVCADAWEDFDKSGFPTFRNAPGKSLIISRTKIGEELVQEVLQKKDIIFHKEIKDYRDIDKMQPGQLWKKIYFLSRLLGLLFLNKPAPRFNSDFYLRATFKSKPITFIKNFIGIMGRT